MACKYTYKGITYNSKEEFISKVINPQILGKADVILPIGTSGSGKSTFIKSLPQENLVVIEPDAMRVEFTGNMNDKSKDKEIYIEAANRAIQAIKQGKQVVFDTTNLTKDKRLPFIEAIKKAIPTANIQYKLMELNPELAKQRIKAQIARGENRANVPDSTIDRHAESYKQMLEDIKNEPITPFVNRTPTKTRRILEVQSDLFQKGRDKSNIANENFSINDIPNKFNYKDTKIEKTNEGWFLVSNNEIGIIPETEVISYYKLSKGSEYKEGKQNQFLQLLNKNNNWVTFFVKSIIQDTAKQTITEVQESDVEAKVRELEEEGLLEIDCSRFKAKNGLTTNSKPKFGDWTIIKDLQGKPSHKQGGFDLNIKGNTIEAEGNELVLKNSVGDIAIIPKKDRNKIKDMITDNCYECLNNYIKKLPKNPDIAGDGGVYSENYVKNNFFNRIFRRNQILEKQIMDENKSLYNVGKLKDFKVIEATGKSKDHLENTNRNPEYFPKGDTWFPYLDDVSQPIKLPNKNKYRTLVNDDNLTDSQLRDAVKFDFISHSLHSDPRYNDLSNQLQTKLLTKYDQKFIDNNGGVDAYIRGILSDSKDYQPYKDETSFIEPEFINELKNYVKTGK